MEPLTSRPPGHEELFHERLTFVTIQVKADREEMGDASKDIESLQKQTSEAMQDDHAEGKN